MSIFTTFAIQSMINQLSNPINRNRSAAKISKVMSSSQHTLLVTLDSICQTVAQNAFSSFKCHSHGSRPGICQIFRPAKIPIWQRLPKIGA